MTGPPRGTLYDDSVAGKSLVRGGPPRAPSLGQRPEAARGGVGAGPPGWGIRGSRPGRPVGGRFSRPGGAEYLLFFTAGTCYAPSFAGIVMPIELRPSRFKGRTIEQVFGRSY